MADLQKFDWTPGWMDPDSDGSYVLAVDAETRIAELEAELRITDKLLAERNRVLAAIPGCEAHGDQCVPHALEWLEKATAPMVLNIPEIDLAELEAFKKMWNERVKDIASWSMPIMVSREAPVDPPRSPMDQVAAAACAARDLAAKHGLVLNVYQQQRVVGEGEETVVAVRVAGGAA